MGLLARHPLADTCPAPPLGGRELEPARPAGASVAGEPEAGVPCGEAQAETFEQQLRAAFAEESEAGIEHCTDLILQLEQRPGNRQLLSNLFREFYTMQGSAATVGLSHVADQCREAAALLETLAEGRISVDAERLVDFLIRLTDSLSALLRRAKGAAAREELIVTDVAAEVARLRDEATPPDTPESDGELLCAFAEEAYDVVDHCGEMALELESRPMDRGLLAALLREFHTLKGAAAAVGAVRVVQQIHQGESLLECLSQETARVGGTPLVDFLLRLMDSVNGLIHQACGSNDQRHLILQDVRGEMTRLIGRPLDTAVNMRMTPETAPEQTGGTHPRNGQNTSPRRTPGAARFKVQQTPAPPGRYPSVARNTAAAQSQSSPRACTAMRLTFRRIVQAADAAARQADKLIDLQVEGAETTFNRQLVKVLYPVLLHLVRNAVFHGIEPPGTRAAAGKRRAGMVRVAASADNDSAVFTVQDDGAGLRFDLIAEKARAAGLVGARESVDRDGLAALIFRPGFSTSYSVNSLAGRGIGLDIALRQVRTLSGSLSVDSADGRGTTFTLRIPTPDPG